MDIRVCSIAFVLLILAAGCQQSTSRTADTDSTGQVLPTDGETEQVADSAYRAAIAEEVQMLDSTSAVASAYREVEFSPFWTTLEGGSAHADSLLAILERAERDGLDPAAYPTSSLRQTLRQLENGSPSRARLAQAEIQMSEAFEAYAYDLGQGRADPSDALADWHLERTPLEIGPLLVALSQGESPRGVLDRAAPPHEEYARLRDVLHEYQAVAQRGGWPTVAPGSTITRGERSAAVVTLGRRLSLAGHAPASAGRDSLYDEEIASAIARFQERHNLTRDSVIGPNTLDQLNVSVEDRIQTVALNMERWRWMPDSLGARHIRVNVPEFRVRVFDNDQVAMQMEVIVGKTYKDRGTPLFSDQMSHVIFNPYWNIPHGIAVEEIIPKARENPAYLAENDYEIVETYGPGGDPLPVTRANIEAVADGSLRLRQDNGPGNSLGQVKYMFPNQFSIYLHDTPADHLFDRVERDFSHGCIRLEKPVEFGTYVFAYDEQWDRQRIQAAFDGDEWERVELDRSIPVFILYWTARTTPDGDVQFFEDIYDFDAKVAAALDETQPAV